MTQRFKFYTLGEEVFNSVSHGVGILFSLIGGTVIIMFSALYGSPLSITASAIYAFSLVMMFTMSTLYHAIPFPRVKKVFQILDHNCIYILIAGSYTPITLLLLRDSPRGIYIFAAVWMLTVIGIILNAVDMRKFKHLSLVLYLLMGWGVVFDIREVLARLQPGGIALLLAGGACYTGGVIFYKLKKIRYMHGVWHLFVLAGAVLHYLCILLYIVL